MAGTTPNLGLYLPGGGSSGAHLPDEVADIDPLNGNFEKIDVNVGTVNTRVTAAEAAITDLTNRMVVQENTIMVTDWNNALAPGFYGCNNSATNGPSAFWWHGVVTRNGGAGSEVVQRLRSADPYQGEFVRAWTVASGWSAWNRSLNTQAGVFAGSTDANGYITITHGLGRVPSSAQASLNDDTPVVGNELKLNGGGTNLSTTTFQVRVYRLQGGAFVSFSNNPVKVSWSCSG